MASYVITNMDSELRIQLEQCELHFRGNDFRKFLQAQRRFDGNGPVYVTDSRKEIYNRPIYNYHLRKTLNGIPTYMKSIEPSGLSYEQGMDLLLHLFNGDKYNFTDKESQIIILRKFLDASKEDKSLSKSVDKIKEVMTAGVGGSGMGGSLYGSYIASRLGIPTAQSAPMVVRGTKGSYVVGPFNEALKSMLPAKPNPKLIVEAFNIMDGNGKNYWSSGNYKVFKQCMTFAVPSMGISIDNMLAKFISAAKERKELECPDDKQLKVLKKEKYFLPYNGELDHFAQPYVTRRSLKEGLADLLRLADASYNEWEEVGEGMFVFDPKMQLWYSLGGELELPSMGEVLSGRAERVRHNFLPYDVSNLSETPFMFHVHPCELDTFLKPDEKVLTYPYLREHITKFLMATPSRADYKVIASIMKEAKREIKPRSFIAHELGITEFVYPNDIKVIEDMGEKSRDLRDQSLLYPPMRLLEMNEKLFVVGLIKDLNTRLPEGFSINLNQKL